MNNGDACLSSAIVYVLTNRGYRLKGMPVVKVGFTAMPMAACLQQLYVTGVPFPFEVAYQATVRHARAAVLRAQASLAAQRLNPGNGKRDFFVCPPDVAIAALEQAMRDLGVLPIPPLPGAANVGNGHPPAGETERDMQALRLRHRNEKPGWIYVFGNGVYHDGNQPLLKIGYTSIGVEARRNELYSSAGRWRETRGVPQRFDALYSQRFELAFDAETEVHALLDAFRVNRYREFFACSLEQAKEAIRTVLAQERERRAARDAAVIVVPARSDSLVPPPVPLPDVQESPIESMPMRVPSALPRPNRARRRRWAVRFAIFVGVLVVSDAVSPWTQRMEPDRIPEATLARPGALQAEPPARARVRHRKPRHPVRRHTAPIPAPGAADAPEPDDAPSEP